MIMRSFQDYLTRRRTQCGSRFDGSQLPQEFVRYFESGERVRVDFGHETLSGTVGITTGWRPVFLLMRRSSDHGSSYTISASDKVTHVKVGRAYVRVTQVVG